MKYYLQTNTISSTRASNIGLTFWKIISGKFDFINGYAELALGGWVSSTSYTSGYQAIDFRYVYVGQDKFWDIFTSSGTPCLPLAYKYIKTATYLTYINTSTTTVAYTYPEFVTSTICTL